MTKKTINFAVKLLLFAALLFGVHFYIIIQFFEENLYFPIFTIYIFNAALVFGVFLILNYKATQGSDKMYQLFLGLTLLKMVLAIVFLLPLFFGKSEHSQLEVINFFIPYFLFLIFEIFNLNKFLQKH